MAALKKWLGWIVFCGLIPSFVLLVLARRLIHNELAYYAISAPSLLLYFYLLGVLGLRIPGDLKETDQDESVPIILRFEAKASTRVAKIFLWIRSFGYYIFFPVAGASLIFYAVWDRELIGYFLGPGMIWASGGLWAMSVQFLQKKRKEQRANSDKHLS